MITRSYAWRFLNASRPRPLFPLYNILLRREVLNVVLAALLCAVRSDMHDRSTALGLASVFAETGSIARGSASAPAGSHDECKHFSVGVGFFAVQVSGDRGQDSAICLKYPATETPPMRHCRPLQRPLPRSYL